MQPLIRYLRAPFFFLMYLGTILGVAWLFCCTATGALLEVILRLIGIKSPPPWLVLGFGFVGYTFGGLLGGIYLGNLLLGWVGAILFPLAILVLIAVWNNWFFKRPGTPVLPEM